ncbi:MAG: hypothetical protein GC190_19775 [Alphaproteobacteria bacterium]|nr:hypothetical protein [Alphaproteobacteria bacterium]
MTPADFAVLAFCVYLERPPMTPRFRTRPATNSSNAGLNLMPHEAKPPFGPGSSPAFMPIKTLTKVVDLADNAWAINNWKSNNDDAIKGNPGGDGICIFVGLTKMKN